MPSDSPVPVNGSWLLVATASWRVGCVLVTSAGATPPLGALPPPLDCAGPLPDSAGRTPPSGVGVGEGVGVPYWAIEALWWLLPLSARPAPAVLNTMPVTSMARIATRDFIDCFLPEDTATRRRTRCLIWSSSISVACGRPSRRSRMTSSCSVIAH